MKKYICIVCVLLLGGCTTEERRQVHQERAEVVREFYARPDIQACLNQDGIPITSGPVLTRCQFRGEAQ